MLKIGSALTLEVLSGKKEILRCKLHDKVNGGLLVDYPTSEDSGRTVFLQNGTELLVTFITEQDEVYRFKTVVKGKRKNNIPMVVLEEPKQENITKIQRRQFVRIDTSNDIAIHPLQGEFDAFATVTENVSGGGAAIVVPNHVQIVPGLEVMIWLSLPYQDGSIEHLNLNAEIVRVEEQKNNKKIASLKFDKLDDMNQQKLMRFCFEAQIQQKKQGLIE